ncbi:MAG: hypothetical protein QG653_79 [Patescibacteria group bacterium]|nr:hypothetical protein [Patescibacteria group bacterium]
METAFDPIFFMAEQPLMFLAIIVWSLVWKGLALWRSAQNNSRNWFIALLLINTLGILEIIYLYFIAPKKKGV